MNGWSKKEEEEEEGHSPQKIPTFPTERVPPHTVAAATFASAGLFRGPLITLRMARGEGGEMVFRGLGKRGEEMGRNGQKKRGGNELWERDGLRGGGRREGNAATAAPLSHSGRSVGRYSTRVRGIESLLGVLQEEYQRVSSPFSLETHARLGWLQEEKKRLSVGRSVRGRFLSFDPPKRKISGKKRSFCPFLPFPPCMAVGKATF